MKKITIAFLALAFLFPVLSFALSNSDLQAQIEALLAQVQQLQQQLAQQGGSSSSAFCHTFNTNLGIGSSGSDVLALQTILTKEGVGAEKFWTSGVFDETTASAVSAFQEKYKNDVLSSSGLLAGTGYVGPVTRFKLNKLYGCGVMTPNPPATTNTTPTPPKTFACPMVIVQQCLNGQTVTVTTDNNGCRIYSCQSTSSGTVTTPIQTTVPTPTITSSPTTVSTPTPFSIVTSSPTSSVKVGVNYTIPLAVAGGPALSGSNTSIYDWSVSSGSLPPGLALSSTGSGEVISGTITTAGTYNFL